MLFVIPTFVLSTDEHGKKCATWFGCANQRELSYPFWTPDRKECGHPDFKVNCSGDFAEISISSVKFQILDAKFDIIRLAIKDYHNNLCPRYPENVTINHDVIGFSTDAMNSILYYNCSDPRVHVPPGFQIRKLDCKDDIGGHSYFVSSALHSWDRAILEKSSASCERNVTIPVARSALRIQDGNPTLEAIKMALNEGFEVTANSECLECTKSNGSCGYNDSSRAFVCYCVDGPHKGTCDSGIAKTSLYEAAKPKLTTQHKLGIGFGCGFLGATLLAGAVLCLIYRRRKKLAAQYTSEHFTTSSIYPTMEMGTGVACGFLGFRKSETSHHPRDHKLKALLQLKQYSYAQVKKITRSFSHTIGTGGFGTVYGGNLCNGRKVAVKVLKNIKSSGEDFINEVASMSQTSHVNIVSLLDFCYEGSQRAIVYEFLENGLLTSSSQRSRR
ncbi:Protein kinase superfamily protein [Raphanus sativus]|nr:Protein kinase superfamily protein [Raphanus sativus]